MTASHTFRVLFCIAAASTALGFLLVSNRVSRLEEQVKDHDRAAATLFLDVFQPASKTPEPTIPHSVIVYPYGVYSVTRED